jgi:predicted DNA-binding mobile mystery protein A
MNSWMSAQARVRLDERFGAMPAVSTFTPPVRGWARAIREAIGMSTAQLARRAGVRQPSIVAAEQSEAKGTIEMATLRRIAEALDCRLVYALVPNKPLNEVVRDRARVFARRQLDPIEHSMALEDQKVTRGKVEERIDEILRETRLSRLWDEP